MEARENMLCATRTRDNHVLQDGAPFPYHMDQEEAEEQDTLIFSQKKLYTIGKKLLHQGKLCAQISLHSVQMW